MIIEFIATTLDDAINIEKAGGDRIELVSALSEGGLTPSIGLIVSVVETVSIPVNVMLRPHSHGFIYSASDMIVMESDLLAVSETKANGVVLGMLDTNGNVNINQLEMLLSKVKNKDVVFHMAIDEANDAVESAKVISRYDEVKAILTSGGKGDINERAKNILKMKEAAPELQIIFGRGIDVSNFSDVINTVGAEAYHMGTAIRENNSPFFGVRFDLAAELVSLGTV